VGGSIIVPDKIDINFLKKLNKLIRSHLKKYKFVIITGGGKIARNYQNAAKAITKLSGEDLDWLGIQATILNAHLVRSVCKDVAYKKVITNPTVKIRFDNLLIAAGWKPGCSTDTDAVLLAENLKAKTVINMSNIDYVYNKDPKKHKTAKPLERISWKQMKGLVGSKWKPGLNLPFDPIATKKASLLKLKVIVMGNSLNNLKNFLDHKKFKGTIIG